MAVNGSCKDGLLVPALGTSPVNAVLYLIALFYCFLGVAIAADVFMCAIERITSSKRRIRKKPQASALEDSVNIDEQEVEYDEVAVWNPTVANLTLMALGSSAPEILLSIIEIVGNRFTAGELGPGTIVGSAAFNLLCITAICVIAVPSPKTSRIAEFAVFGVTALFSCFAYLWLLVILVVFSPNVVQVWEGALTLGFFVLLIVFAYLADIKIWQRRRAKKVDLEFELVDGEKNRLADPDVQLRRYVRSATRDPGLHYVDSSNLPHEEAIHSITRQINRIYPNLCPDDQAKLLASRLKRQESHDRFFYRILATRWMAAALRKTQAEHEVEKIEKTEPDGSNRDLNTVPGTKGQRTIEFSARVYAIQPHDRSVTLTVIRRGNNEKPLRFHWNTVNGIAKKDLHYLPKSETVQFERGETEKQLTVKLVDGADWRPNAVFYVHLKLQSSKDGDDDVILGPTSIARVRVPADSGNMLGTPLVEFVRNNYIVKENSRTLRVFVILRGKRVSQPFNVTYETEDVSAVAGKDYRNVENGVLHFSGNEHEKYIDIAIIDDQMEEKDETFNVLLTGTDHPEVAVGYQKWTVVTILSDENLLKNISDVYKLLPHYLDRLTPHRLSWKEQIVTATSVNAGDTENATLGDVLRHAVAFPWKLLFAFVPPAPFLGGWLTFVIALILIGLITAIIGDLASIFGCMVGIKDTITAITLVALGTSLPDTFASQIAAKNDPTADNAIGNVTGSNSVNVFLGLGLPWLIAAIYWASKGQPFQVEAGNLGFSVGVYMVMSVLCLGLLVMRRMSPIFGRAELGGPVGPKVATALFLILLWLLYIALSIAQVSGTI